MLDLIVLHGEFSLFTVRGNFWYQIYQNQRQKILCQLMALITQTIYTHHRRLAGGTKYCTRTRVQYFICPRGRQPEEDIFSYSTEGPSGPSAIRFFRPRVEVMWIISTSVSFFLQILVFTLVSSRDPFLIQFHFYFQHVSHTIVPPSRRGMISSILNDLTDVHKKY